MFMMLANTAPSSTLHFFQSATLCLGILCVTLSALLALYFFRSPRSLGKAMGFMLGAEACMGFATVIFAGWTVFFHSAPPDVMAMILRWFVFLAASASSLHLGWHIYRIITENDK